MENRCKYNSASFSTDGTFYRMDCSGREMVSSQLSVKVKRVSEETSYRLAKGILTQGGAVLKLIIKDMNSNIIEKPVDKMFEHVGLPHLSNIIIF